MTERPLLLSFTALQSSLAMLVSFASQPALAAPVPATPAPMRATSLSGGATSPVLQVASELKAFGTVQNPGKDVVAFETPLGFGHSKGGRGVLVKNEASSGRKGSTWSVQWTGSLISNLLFIHPHNGGYIIVRLAPQGAEPVVLSSFQRQPMMSGGSRALFKETPAAADVYPLKANQKYLVVSQFDSKGRYTLTIDGKVVQTGGFNTPGDVAVYTSTNPLTLPEGFKGENLPVKWRSGYAALIVGPVAEGSANLCENITYQASASGGDKAAR